MFHRSAEIYDAAYSFKDYTDEAEQIHALIHRRCPGAATLLDVACGTGKHLELLSTRYEAAGLDIDEELLAVARRRVPDVPLHAADMTSFELGRRFDAVICMFSAIGYAGTVDRLQRAIGSMARHLAPAGVLIVEPWVGPEEWAIDRPALVSVDEPDFKLARMNVSARDGRLAIIDFHYLVATPAGVESFTEHHELALYTGEEYALAFASAGLQVEHDSYGLTGRGLYIASQSH